MPWRVNRTPYRVFVSEIMLQQTSVARVMKRYAAFLRAFPSFRRLASASVQEVIATWKGLGYNRRALALRESARLVINQYRGRLPSTASELVKLPGVGPATAAAIIAYAFDKPSVFIETNIRRVFIHHFFPDQEQVPDSLLLPLVEKTLVTGRPRDWYYALMDYGAALSEGGRNPNRRSRSYKVQSRFEGSLRQLRGRILAAALAMQEFSPRQIQRIIGEDPRLAQALAQLVEEGFLSTRRGRYSFKNS
jgi:A/G-specific adenine glycosylase